MIKRASWDSFADQFMIRAAVGHDLPEYCAKTGVNISELANQIGIDLRSFSDFEAEIKFQKFCNLLDEIARSTGDDAFGISYGMYSKRGPTGPFGMGLSVAPNFKYMLEFYAKFIHVAVDLDTLKVRIEKDSFTIEWSYSPLMSRTEHYADLAATLGQKLFEQFIGSPVYPIHSQLKRDPPKDIQLHARVYSKNIRFGAESNAVTFPASYLEFQNPSGDQMMFNYWSQQCRSILVNKRNKKDIVMALKEYFLTNLGTKEIVLSEAADRFGLSERTLQRRLTERGFTFWELYRTTRDERSRQLLKDSDLSLSAISHKLGYSSQGAYTRAVKQLHNKTPKQLRNELRAILPSE